MKRWLPSREKIVASRWLGPLAPRLADEHLWHLDRGGVARAVAIGLFFGLALPIGQFLFAVAAAIWLRAHVGIAAAATLITNPLTFGPIYWLAYRVGRPLWNGLTARAESAAEAAAAEAPPIPDVDAAATATGWIAAAWDSLQALGMPLIVGLAVLAVTAATVGYAGVWLLWRPART